MRSWARVDTPVGPLTVVVGAEGAESIGFDAAPPDDGVQDDGLEAAEQLRAWLRGERRRFDLPLAPVGTDFQQQVWAVLRDVPYGTTTTYGALAERLGKPPGASRAVGAANGANPLAIVVPCHRVIGSDGSLTGYAGGLERKRWLLGHEQGAPGLPFG